VRSVAGVLAMKMAVIFLFNVVSTAPLISCRQTAMESVNSMSLVQWYGGSETFGARSTVKFEIKTEMSLLFCNKGRTHKISFFRRS
jgi:hypothetical protein